MIRRALSQSPNACRAPAGGSRRARSARALSAFLSFLLASGAWPPALFAQRAVPIKTVAVQANLQAAGAIPSHGMGASASALSPISPSAKPGGAETIRAQTIELLGYLDRAVVVDSAKRG